MANENGWMFNEETRTLTIFDEHVLSNDKLLSRCVFDAKKIIIREGVKSIGVRAFEGCSILRSITIPNTVTTIGDRAFDHCESLTEIAIPDSVTSIGSYAFCGCYNLTEITIPDSVTAIGENAFFACRGLTVIQVDPNNTTYVSVDGVLFNRDKTMLIRYPSGKPSSRYEIPDAVKSIGICAFYHCYNLAEITIPDSVTSIGDLAFCWCHSLTEITIPDGVTVIGNNAFFDCMRLSAIQVDPNNTTYTSVDGVLFNKEKTELIRYPSAKPSSKYEIPDGVTDIGKDAFYYCCNLTEITIPNTVTTIGDCAFSSCKSLTEITIPDSVTSIGNYIFTGCDKLMNDGKSVYFSDYNKNNGNE